MAIECFLFIGEGIESPNIRGFGVWGASGNGALVHILSRLRISGGKIATARLGAIDKRSM